MQNLSDQEVMEAIKFVLARPDSFEKEFLELLLQEAARRRLSDLLSSQPLLQE
jgi:hypothetical protein